MNWTIQIFSTIDSRYQIVSFWYKKLAIFQCIEIFCDFLLIVL